MQSDDLVILYMGPDHVDYCYLSPEADGVSQNKFGAFHHRDFVGRPFGSKILARTGSKGWLVALKPTPELWASCVRHRTQIVHQLDAALVCFELGIGSGSIVVEAGTGSGAMSTALARCVGLEGHLFTFDFNEDRVEAARAEFERNGLARQVTCAKSDVTSQGFGGVEKPVDAVFLDLPEPWLAVPHIRAVAKPGAVVASYSPCVEQAQRTTSALGECGVYGLRTLEARQRDLEVRDLECATLFADEDTRSASYTVAVPRHSMRGHTAFLTFATLA